jgi:hypothetical protein
MKKNKVLKMNKKMAKKIKREVKIVLKGKNLYKF